MLLVHEYYVESLTHMHQHTQGLYVGYGDLPVKGSGAAPGAAAAVLSPRVE